jgi:hypothetical protein
MMGFFLTYLRCHVLLCFLVLSMMLVFFFAKLGLKNYIVTKFPKLCRQTLCLIPLVRPNAVLSKFISNFSLSFLPKVQGENTMSQRKSNECLINKVLKTLYFLWKYFSIYFYDKNIYIKMSQDLISKTIGCSIVVCSELLTNRPHASKYKASTVFK